MTKFNPGDIAVIEHSVYGRQLVRLDALLATVLSMSNHFFSARLATNEEKLEYWESKGWKSGANFKCNFASGKVHRVYVNFHNQVCVSTLDSWANEIGFTIEDCELHD